MKKVLRYILLVFVLLLLIGGIKIYQFFTMPNPFEVLIGLLEEPQNKKLNTTEEKTGFTPYQILDGNLYYEKDGLCQYNYESNKRKKLWDEDIYEFKIMKGKIYYAKMRKDRDNNDHNFCSIECRDLENLHKEQVVEGVTDWVFSGESIFFSHMIGNKRYIQQYDISTQQCKEIVAFNIFDQDGESKQGEMELVIDQNIIFEDTGGRYLILYNMQTKKWNKLFQFQFQEKELYYRITGIQVRGDDLYVQGTVCDSRINDLGGSRVVNDAEENGVWRVDIKTGQKEQVTNTVYCWIYILDGILYGIDYGKYEVIPIK